MAMNRPKTTTQAIIEKVKTNSESALQTVKQNAVPALKSAGNFVKSEIVSAANNEMSHAKESAYVAGLFGFVWLLNGDLPSFLFSASFGALALFQKGLPQEADKMLQQHFGKSVSGFIGGYFAKPTEQSQQNTISTANTTTQNNGSQQNSEDPSQNNKPKMQ